MSKQNTTPYVHLDLRKQIYMECKSMAKYALAKGKAVPVDAIKNIETFEDYSLVGKEVMAYPQIRTDIDIAGLIDAHGLLARLIEPATPQTVLLLHVEQKAETAFRFLGPVSLVRQLMLAAVISLLIFTSLMASPFIDGAKLAQDVLAADGIEQLARLFFYIGAAGLGASFTALYTANEYISKGTYDPCYQSSYWIRFLLGIIAGLLLSLLISEQSMMNDGMLSKGIVRPLLAILGGFSADLFYTFLNRMVETFKSLFETNAQNMLDAKAKLSELEAKAKFSELEAKAKRSELEVERLVKLMQQPSGAEADLAQVKQIKDVLGNIIQAKQAS